MENQNQNNEKAQNQDIQNTQNAQNPQNSTAYTQNSTLATPITPGEKKAEAAMETAIPAFSAPIGDKVKKVEKTESAPESFKETVKEPVKETKAETKKKKAEKGDKKSVGKIIGDVIILIILILFALLLLLAGGIIFAVQIPAVRDVLPFDTEWMVFVNKDDGEKTPDKEVLQEKEEWRFEGYEERYPFYALNRKYVDGNPTDEYVTDTEKTKYTEEEAKIFYRLDTETGMASRILYLNGVPTDYVEYVNGMSDEEWALEGYDTDFREYARLYKYGKMTEKTAYTGRVFEHAYFVDYEIMQKILYVDGKPVSSYEITALEDDEWVLEGYEADTFRQYARRYISSLPTDETKYTGVVYEAVEYYKLDAFGMPYKLTYVNGAPMPNQKPEYIEGLGYVEEAWVIAEDYEAGTFREYAVLHNYGVKDLTRTKYTGLIKEIIEWKVEGYSRSYPYYQYERKYVNGEKTSETRNSYPAKTDPSKAGSSKPSSTVQTKPEYINPDGSINFSMLRLEYWYDSDKREYKIWYDKNGNEVTRFATGAYKVERNKK